MTHSRRTVIIGIDGAPYSLIAQLCERGVMPFVDALRGDAVFRPLRSSIPAVSSVSWSSIITGCDPGEHGIFGFSEMMEGTYALSFPNFLSLKAPPFWQDASAPCVILNVPTTYPAQPLNGCLVSGFISPRLDRAVYPPEELATLEGMGYRIDLDANRAGQSELILYKELRETHALREELAEHLWRKYDPALFMLVLTGSDRLGHFGWHHWEDPGHPSHDEFLDYFRRADATIERFAARLGDNDTLILLSDHGMERCAQEVNLNAALIEGGFLSLDEDQGRKYGRIQEGSVAFALEDGRVYLNEVGRYPKGTVAPERADELLDELTAWFMQMRLGGEPVIRRIYRREQIYRGTQVERAPHLVLLARPGLKPMGRLSTEPYEPGRLPGMHNDEAFVLLRAPGAEELLPADPGVGDIVPIIGA